MRLMFAGAAVTGVVAGGDAGIRGRVTAIGVVGDSLSVYFQTNTGEVDEDNSDCDAHDRGRFARGNT